jgi:DNA-binding transcriptional regulator GbsR (MarR family)
MEPLTPPVERFVVHWGEMGTRWGISRAVAQVHALIMVAEAPVTAEDIAGALSLARSTVSASLKELQSWELIRVAHVLGDRRDHFEPSGDVWDMALLVADGRKRREIDPTIEVLRECLAQMDGKGPERARSQLEDLTKFIEGADALYEQVRRLPRPALRQLLSRGASLAGLLR